MQPFHQKVCIVLRKEFLSFLLNVGQCSQTTLEHRISAHCNYDFISCFKLFSLGHQNDEFSKFFVTQTVKMNKCGVFLFWLAEHIVLANKTTIEEMEDIFKNGLLFCFEEEESFIKFVSQKGAFPYPFASMITNKTYSAVYFPLLARIPQYKGDIHNVELNVAVDKTLAKSTSTEAIVAALTEELSRGVMQVWITLNLARCPQGPPKMCAIHEGIICPRDGYPINNCYYLLISQFPLNAMDYPVLIKFSEYSVSDYHGTTSYLMSYLRKACKSTVFVDLTLQNNPNVPVYSFQSTLDKCFGLVIDPGCQYDVCKNEEFKVRCFEEAVAATSTDDLDGFLQDVYRKLLRNFTIHTARIIMRNYVAKSIENATQSVLANDSPPCLSSDNPCSSNEAILSNITSPMPTETMPLVYVPSTPTLLATSPNPSISSMKIIKGSAKGVWLKRGRPSSPIKANPKKGKEKKFGDVNTYEMETFQPIQTVLEPGEIVCPYIFGPEISIAKPTLSHSSITNPPDVTLSLRPSVEHQSERSILFKVLKNFQEPPPLIGSHVNALSPSNKINTHASDKDVILQTRNEVINVPTEWLIKTTNSKRSAKKRTKGKSNDKELTDSSIVLTRSISNPMSSCSTNLTVENVAKEPWVESAICVGVPKDNSSPLATDDVDIQVVHSSSKADQNVEKIAQKSRVENAMCVGIPKDNSSPLVTDDVDLQVVHSSCKADQNVEKITQKSRVENAMCVGIPKENLSAVETDDDDLQVVHSNIITNTRRHEWKKVTKKRDMMDKECQTDFVFVAET